MGIKEFWRCNKGSYIWSCIVFSFLSLFLGLVKKNDMNATYLSTLALLPVIFLMAYGIYEFTGGEK